jgi:hypothetical protein
MRDHGVADNRIWSDHQVQFSNVTQDGKHVESGCFATTMNIEKGVVRENTFACTMDSKKRKEIAW